jgi:hypothetical protein
MKKQFILIVLLIVGITLVGCQATLASDSNKEDALSENSSALISDYYPFLENTLLDYEGEGNEYAEQKTYFEFIEDNRAQLKVINPGTNMIKILELKDGALSEIYLEGEFYHIENMIKTKASKQDIILKEPLEVGNSWTTQEGYQKEITSIDAKVSTPYGTLDALEVTTAFDEGRLQKDYYSKGIGLVARIYTDGEMEVKTLLKEIKETPLTHEIVIYYPLSNNEGTVYINDSISFRTNDRIEKILEFKLKNPPSEQLLANLPEEVSISSIHLDRGDWIVKVDLSDNFLTELNAGSTYEYQVIESIVNTLAKFYDTDKVYISINGRPYESGHIQLIEGDFFKINIEDVFEFKH